MVVKVKRKTIYSLLMLAIVLFSTSKAETVWGDLSSRFASNVGIEFGGNFFAMRSRITSILFMGIDKRNDEGSTEDEYRNGGQADFLMLLVIDDNRKTITPIQINRDTMCEITVLNVLGAVSGTRTAQVCLSHGFGDGRTISCELTMDAVSNLIYGIPLNHYYAMNMDGIAVFNDAIGGVEVTLEDDFSKFDPSMTKGETITLRGVQAEYYTRNRYNVGDQTNLSRTIRQEKYIQQAGERIRNEIIESPNYILSIFDILDEYVTTDMGRGYVLNISKKAREYEILPLVELIGTTEIGRYGFVEFYPDEEALKQLLIEVYCEMS